MAFNLSPHDADPSMFSTTRRYGIARPEENRTQAPWSDLLITLGLVLPLMFGNVVVAIFAWFVVELIMR
jgi:hypothetical protein